MKRITIALAAAFALLSFGAMAGEEAPAKDAAAAKPAKTVKKTTKKVVKEVTKDAASKDAAKTGEEKPADAK